MTKVNFQNSSECRIPYWAHRNSPRIIAIIATTSDPTSNTFDCKMRLLMGHPVYWFWPLFVDFLKRHSLVCAVRPVEVVEATSFCGKSGSCYFFVPKLNGQPLNRCGFHEVKRDMKKPVIGAYAALVFKASSL